MKTQLLAVGIVLAMAFAVLQVLGGQNHVYPSGAHWFELTATEVDSTGFTVIGDDTPLISGLGTMNEIVVLNVGTLMNVTACVTGGDLVAFKVERKSSPNADWRDYVSGTDFDTATSSLPFIEAEGPHEIEADECAMFDLNVRGAYAVRFSATTNGGDDSAPVTVYVAVRE